MSDLSLIEGYISKSIAVTEARLKRYSHDEKGMPRLHRYASFRIKKLIDDFMDRGSENRWILIPGLRGTGKTTILAQSYFHLRTKGVIPQNILYFSLDEVSRLLKTGLYEVLSVFESLKGEYIETLKEPLFLLLDEVHYDSNWGTTLKTIFDKSKNVFVICTGSSAISLTTNSDIVRRVQTERVIALGFPEYLMLRDRKMPIPKLKEKIEKILYSSSSAREVFENLKMIESQVNSYWMGVTKIDFENYLSIGSLPFALELKEKEEIFHRIIEMLGRIIFEDLPATQEFDRNSLSKIMHVLVHLASSDVVSIESITKHLGIDKKTVQKILGSMCDAELLYRVSAWSGSAVSAMRKPPKYFFLASSIRAALLSEIGIFSFEKAKGRLLEDIVILHLFKMNRVRKLSDIHYDASKGGADFILTKGDEKIVIEVGFGDKQKQQAKQTLEKVDGKYGLVISQTELSIEDEVVNIPIKFFLLS